MIAALLSHRRTRVFLTVYAIALLAFLLTACGGGDPEDDCAVPTLATAAPLLGATVEPRCRPRDVPPPKTCREHPELCK